MASCWQTKYKFYTQALPSFNCPIKPKDLMQLACEEYIEARMLHCHTDKPWELETGPFEPNHFSSTTKSPYSLLVQAVDHWNSDVQALLKLFHFIPSWRLDDIMISVSSNGAGVGPHYDQYDVFLIQASGTRTWEVGPVYDESAAKTINAGLSQLSEMEVIERFDVVAGDVLYLPPGVAHNGVATSDDCMTISIGFRAPSHAEILTDFAAWNAEKTMDSQRFSDPGRALLKNPKEIQDSDIASIQNILMQYAQDTDQIRQWFGSVMTEQKYPELMPENLGYSLNDWMHALDDSSDVFLDPASRIAFDALHVFFDSRVYQRKILTAHQFNQMVTNDKFSASEFKQFIGHSEALDQLILDSLNLGTYYLE